ncbi:hypothetical protein AgCh_008610 [Apium graveolens]
MRLRCDINAEENQKFTEFAKWVLDIGDGKEALGSARPTHSRIMIRFSQLTTIEKIDVDDFMIPLHKFEIGDMNNLFCAASEHGDNHIPPFSTDIIGVEDFERVKSIKTIYGDKDIVKFRITDGSVWDDMANDIDRLYIQVMEEPIIAIVTSTKMKIFRIIVNPTPELQFVTLHELGLKTNIDDIKKTFLCVVKITDVKEIVNWWYNSYANCDNEEIELADKIKMANLAKLEFVVLDVSGNNYLSWVLDVELYLSANGLKDTIDLEKIPTVEQNAKAIIFLRHHIHEDLKYKYLIIKNPLTLWNNLKDRFDHQKLVHLPSVRYD